MEEELDALLALEDEMLVESGRKRSLADLQSRQDAAHSLQQQGPSPGSSKKRSRTGAAAAPPQQQQQPADADGMDDEELLQLAMQSQLPSQGGGAGGAHQAHSALGGHTFLTESETENRELIALAAQSQSELAPPSLAAFGGGGGGGSVAQGRGGGGMGASAAGGGGKGGGGGGGWDDELDMDAAIEDFLNEQLDDDFGEDGDDEQATGTGGSRPTPPPQKAAAPAAVAAAGAHAPHPAAAAAPLAPAAGQQQPQQQQQGSTAVVDVLPRRQYVPPVRESYRVQGACVSVTSATGERVYCQVEQPICGTKNRRLDAAGALRRVRGGLLSAGIDSLLEAVEKSHLERALAETHQQGRAQAARAAAGAAAAAPAAAGAVAAGGKQGGEQRQASLWVDKYAPQGFMDLLSDEQINREVVHWIKCWDPCVFGRAAPAAPAPQGRSFGARGGAQHVQQQHHQPQQQGAGRGADGFFGGGGGPAADTLGRPQQKVILICGPPGLGKTTLAHVCAAHCGYRPVEINASDDRSGDSLQRRLLDAIEMQSVMGERKPNMVIIDEIDGATGGAEGKSAIAALLKVVNAAPSSKGSKGGGGRGAYFPSKQAPAAAAAGGDAEDESDSEDEQEGGSRSPAQAAGGPGAGTKATAAPFGGAGRRGRGRGQGARQQLRPLLRPIVCICNDLYAPALRPLRDVARVFTFKKPKAERLSQRLQAICAAEGLHAERSTLRLLVERTDCDVRACLNTLQFLAKRQGSIRLSDLEGLRVGQKDMTKGAFAVWTELLQRKKAPLVIGKVAETEMQRNARLYGMLQDFGEMDLVLGGLQENVFSVRFFDVGLTRTAAVADLLADVDATGRACQRCGDYGLLKYMPASVVALSNVVASHERPQLQWPRAGGEAHRRGAANRAMLQSWMLGIDPAVCAGTSAKNLALEVLPALMHVAAPALRPVSRHLYTAEEQAAVSRVVGVLLSYNLRYSLQAEPEADLPAHLQQQQQQQGVRGAHTEMTLAFRPAVHRVCALPGGAPKGKALPAAVRQTLSHEADLEAIRRAEVVRTGGSTSPGAAAAAGAGSQQREAQGSGGREGPSELDPNRPAASQQQQGGGGPIAGKVQATLAQRMAAAGVGARVAAAQRKGTWLDQLNDQRQQRQRLHGGNGRGAKTKHTVLYKFHEGYTNAVSRPVKFDDLL